MPGKLTFILGLAVAVLSATTPLPVGADAASFAGAGFDNYNESAIPGVPDGFSKSGDVLKIHSASFHADIAFVNFLRSSDDVVLVWMQTDLCIGCKLLPVAYLTKKTKAKHLTASIDTRFPTRIVITLDNATYPRENNTYCDLHYQFQMFGEYNLTVPMSVANSSTVTECHLEMVKDPVYPNTAILVLYGSIFFAFFCAAIWFHCIRKTLYKNKNIENGTKAEDELPLTVQNNHNKRATSTRLRSVDAFRGLAITHLVLGASGDGQYWYTMHARWYGITVADFMFPWFMFIMGTSIHLAFNILLSKGKSFGSIYKKLIFRSIALFVIGVCIQPHNDLRTLRIPGVLQRFGITYFIVASSYLLSRWLLMNRKTERTASCYLAFRDIFDYLELPLAAVCLAIHLCLTFLLPVPGCPRGYLGPGGPLVGVDGELTNCTGGAAGYIDRVFFTEAHIIRSSTPHKVYHTTLNHDPEGILGTFTSIALCVFGLQAGKILSLFSTARGRCVRLVIWGLLLIACSAVLTKCQMAGGWIPLTKNLWSVSFIALTGGTAFLIQAIFHLLIDVNHFWNGAPLFYAGMNSILLYVGAEIMSGYLPFSWAPFVGNHAEFVLLGAWSMALWLLIAYVAYRKKIFLKL